MGNGAVVPDAGKPSMNAPQSNPALTTVNDDQIETALDAMWPSNERYYDDAHGSAEAGMKAALAALSPQPQVDWEAKFKSEQRACNHWFNEANKSHNEACKIAEEFREYREKHQQPQVTEEEIAAVLKQADSEAPMGDGFYPYLARAIIARLTGSVK